MMRDNELRSGAGPQPSRAALSGSVWGAAITRELQTSGGSSAEAAAGSYQALFDAELQRKNCSLVTISDQVFLAPRPFFLAPNFSGVPIWGPFGCQLLSVTVCKQDNCAHLE